MKYYCTLFLLLILGCTAAQSQEMQTIRCDADSTQSYTLCLPPGYHKTQKYPVVFLFDPGARGRNAVSQYQKTALDYGFILIASNNSRNGPMNMSLNAANAMFGDAFKKYILG